MLGPKGSPEAVDLVCDLHNSTANMGLCLIAYSDCDWICLHIFRHLQARAKTVRAEAKKGVRETLLERCAFVEQKPENDKKSKAGNDDDFQRQMPDIPVRYIHFDISSKESYSLDSVGKHGFGMQKKKIYGTGL